MTRIRKNQKHSGTPVLAVVDNGKFMNIDIQIPGITKDRVEVIDHVPCVKKSVSVLPSQELVHIAFPKEPYWR